MGIRDKPIAPGSPWQNGFAESLIGSIRRECTDHLIALSEGHLRRTLQAYARFHRPAERLGTIISQPVIGGLHHQYCRI
jgi:transposase InsO family protein